MWTHVFFTLRTSRSWASMNFITITRKTLSYPTPLGTGASGRQHKSCFSDVADDSGLAAVLKSLNISARSASFFS